MNATDARIEPESRTRTNVAVAALLALTVLGFSRSSEASCGGGVVVQTEILSMNLSGFDPGSVGGFIGATTPEHTAGELERGTRSIEISTSVGSKLGRVFIRAFEESIQIRKLLDCHHGKGTPYP